MLRINKYRRPGATLNPANLSGNTASVHHAASNEGAAGSATSAASFPRTASAGNTAEIAAVSDLGGKKPVVKYDKLPLVPHIEQDDHQPHKIIEA